MSLCAGPRRTAVRSVDLDQGNELAAPWRHQSEERPLHRKVLAVCHELKSKDLMRFSVRQKGIKRA